MKPRLACLQDEILYDICAVRSTGTSSRTLAGSNSSTVPCLVPVEQVSYVLSIIMFL